MRLVIDIPEEIYQGCLKYDVFPSDVYKSIKNGVPLPKGHGRLIDAEHLKETLDYYICEAGWSREHNESLKWCEEEFIDAEPTIIEADKGE